MAFVTETRTGGTTFFSRLASLRVDLQTRYAKHRVYRTTFKELNALSSRDLADLGINRTQIKSIAYEAAYKG